ncbi:asparagine synthase (glutamine-hydrolyzing) [Microvirga sp. 17 mud 1-3]|uniref:asparagine synthase (glutamine-hydrolyzing) n=1 Tax=Microvirga sp. 17 mud 1-3 TaxID=2082949 RepID=UPI000D6C75F0|nr:asparagine synthase (glutamine-hydrolyzing) [Microvirga sp. 17 mud 1-3]AWM87679.1 asparagine synthase (glutamine-hydrolyzing) [Microvirga sp. 17 mud 1-3]
MCGIYTSIGFDPERQRIDIIAHRGPDGSGWREFPSKAGPVALGHRRLAIIDVSDAGLQPMADETGRFWLVFNGEIYNYLELREELRHKGHFFKSDSDSEVLLASYREWGDECLNRLMGMFAFLIWDAREQRLFAARDRFGIKPMYMVVNSHGVAFGSEIKQLLGLRGIENRMNLARVRDFLASGISDHTPETMFEGVVQLQAGCCVTIDASQPWSGYCKPRRWYQLPAHSTLNISEAEAAERFRELLTDSVRMHLRSDVPVGSCLSGGLDSSSIVCLMSDMLDAEGRGAKVNTVSACYAEKSVDEKPFMEAVVARTGAHPHYIFPRGEDVFARASDITWHQDEPFGSTSIFSQWCVFEEAKRAGIKVMLDGQGADEQLAGYHSSYSYYMSDLIRRRDYITLLRTMIERDRVHGVSFIDQFKRFIGPVLPSQVRGFLLRQRQAIINHDWMGSDVLRSLQAEPSAFEKAIQVNGLSPVTDIASLCVVLTFASNLQMLLHWEDRNSMAHSIEARVPFLDHRLVEFNLALGNAHKIVRSDTKRVLRKAMSHTLPEAVRERRDKLGFSTPEEAWFRGPLRHLIQDGVEATIRRYPDLLEPKGTRALMADMLDGRRSVDFTLWRIVNLGVWGERFGVSL